MNEFKLKNKAFDSWTTDELYGYMQNLADAKLENVSYTDIFKERHKVLQDHDGEQITTILTDGVPRRLRKALFSKEETDNGFTHRFIVTEDQKEGQIAVRIDEVSNPDTISVIYFIGELFRHEYNIPRTNELDIISQLTREKIDER